MLERERQRLIVKLVEERSIVSIAELAGLLGASEATLRRDISALAERGDIKRVRGGAEAVHPRLHSHLVGMPFDLSRDVRAAQKRAIARAAATLISPGESIVINGGTTTFALVEFLVHQRLDILTNSFPIAAQLVATSRNRITVPGGTIFPEQNIILSPFQNDSLSNFWGRKLFTSCYGINRFGLMEADPLIVQAQAKLLQRAEEVIVMADSSKLRQHSSMIVMSLERISILVTDSGVKASEIEVFQAANVQVIVADAAADEGLKASA